MLTSADEKILQEVYQNSKSAVEEINTVISKVYDEDLALDLNKQASKFLELEGRAIQKLGAEGVKPAGDNPVNKARQWTRVQSKTLMNVSTGHIADMMIQSNAKKMTEMLKTVKGNRTASDFAMETANELMDFEEKNIQKLKSFL